MKEMYEELFKKNYSRMFYCALDFVNDTETAKDIVGDACCETWRRLGMSVSAVHKHVSKAFAKFRKAFGVKISSTEVTILTGLLLLI